MYTLPICFLVAGILFLTLHVRFFLLQYKRGRVNQPLMVLSYINYIGLMSSISVIILSIIDIFIISQQL